MGYLISNIQTEAGPLGDQEIIKSDGQEMIISGGAENTEEEDDTPMSGATSTIEDAEEDEAAQRELETGKPCLKRGKVATDGNRFMGVGPYRMSTYGEVLRSNPEYAKYLIKENKRDNQKARFAHWIMAFVVETFFEEDKKEKEEILEEGSQIRET